MPLLLDCVELVFCRALTPEEQRDILADAYWMVAGRLSGRPYQEETREMLEQALAIYRYAREKLPTEFDGSLSEVIQHVIYLDLESPPRTTLGGDVTPPRVVRVHPRDGQRTGKRPTIAVWCHDGDALESQLNFRATTLALDGTLIPLNSLRIDLKQSRQWRNVKEFEDVRIRLHPDADLTPGLHVLSIHLVDGGGSATDVNQRFTVVPGLQDAEPDF